MVVSLGILLVNEVGIVGTDEFDAIFTSQFYQHLIGFLLQRVRLAVGTDGGVFHLMALQLQIVVVTEEVVIPFDGLTGSGDVVFQYLGRYLTGNTGRADHQPLVVFLQVFAVGTGTHIVAVNPRVADQFNQVLIALIVLG